MLSKRRERGTFAAISAALSLSASLSFLLFQHHADMENNQQVVACEPVLPDHQQRVARLPKICYENFPPTKTSTKPNGDDGDLHVWEPLVINPSNSDPSYGRINYVPSAAAFRKAHFITPTEEDERVADREIDATILGGVTFIVTYAGLMGWSMARGRRSQRRAEAERAVVQPMPEAPAAQDLEFELALAWLTAKLEEIPGINLSDTYNGPRS